MSAHHAAWQAENDRFLAVALAWLRLRLERRAPPHPADAPRARAGDPPGSVWDRLRGRGRPHPAHGALALLPPFSGGSLDEQIDEAAAELKRFESAQRLPALLELARLFGLSRFERDLLLLAAAMELDTRIPALCAAAQEDPAKAYPTFALALVLFDEPLWNALSPERPLRRYRMVDPVPLPPHPLSASPLRADERIVNYLKGLDHLDERLAAVMRPLPGHDTGLTASQIPAAERALRAAAGERPPVIHLLGADAETRQVVARQVAAAFERPCFRLAADALAGGADLDTLTRLWERETVLRPAALYLDDDDAAGEAAEHALARFAAACPGLCFLDARDPRLPGGRAMTTVEVRRPTAAEQRDAWAQVLGEDEGGAPARLAGQFDLSLPTLARVAAQALADDGGDPAAAAWEGCLAATRPGLERLALRIEPRAGWDDLVLPAPEQALLRQVAAQVAQRTRVYEEWGFARRMNRGLGINALFAGESGTGKTMAAEVIARELRLNLYRIDLSAVVSKYIGETEKNLRRLFDAAEDGGAILFFDEADAIFGKRSEVKDSHDRYANIEVNYLLQRMEAYRGLAVLASNQKEALDPAFLRRLRFVVEFPFPGPAERRRLWQGVFPPEAETHGLDADRLARLNLTGGSIHNVALNAAFQAAHQGTPVTMPLVLAAARAEFRKIGRPVAESELRWAEPALGAA